MYRVPKVAPRDTVEPDRRGSVVGKFCLTCGSVYSRHAPAHRGKPSYGKDHVASTCSHEGQPFTAGAEWWQPAVEVLAAGSSAAG